MSDSKGVGVRDGGKGTSGELLELIDRQPVAPFNEIPQAGRLCPLGSFGTRCQVPSAAQQFVGKMTVEHDPCPKEPPQERHAHRELVDEEHVEHAKAGDGLEDGREREEGGQEE